ncbi:MAG: TetR/AcrR family transcriptional regulator [Mycobacteriales bacterium]
MTTTLPAGRKSADERRETVLLAALEEFSRTGLEGTSTQAIADRAGISQPYLFRLYPSKKALFLAAVQRANQIIVEGFVDAAGDRSGDAAFEAMAERYLQLITDRTFLLMQLQTYAAADDPDVRAAARTGFRKTWEAITRLSGACAEDVRKFYAMGMLCNVVTALDLDAVHEAWACEANPKTGKH